LRLGQRVLIIISISCFLIALLSCNPVDKSGDNNAPTSDELITLGKTSLSQNKGLEAAEAFEKALSLRPDSVDAKFGIILTGPVIFANFIDQILDTVNNLSFEYAIDDEAAPDNPIHKYLLEKVAVHISKSEYIFFDLAIQDHPSFQTERFALEVAGNDLLAFEGEFGKADLFFFGALNSVLDGLLNFILALDLNFDYTVLKLPSMGTNADITETINAIIDLLDELLSSENFPAFLYLDNDGAEHMQKAGIDFGNAFARLSFAFETMASETSSQTHDQFGYYDLNHDSLYDPNSEPVFIGQTVLLAPELAVAIKSISDKMAPIFYEGSVLDSNTNEVDLLTLADFNELFVALGVFPISLGKITIDGFPGLLKFNVGKFFAEPKPDGFRNIILLITKIWEAINPGLNES